MSSSLDHRCSMPPPRLQETLSAELIHAVYQGASDCFLRFRETWPPAPCHDVNMLEWLHYFQGAWMHLELTSQVTGLSYNGALTESLHSRIAAEAMPFATVDWIQKFPAITKGYQDRLIVHFDALFDALNMHLDVSRTILGDAAPKNDLYDTAKCRIEILKANDMMTTEEYSWHSAKFDQECIASVAKQQEMETWMMVKADWIRRESTAVIGVPVDPSITTPVHTGVPISDEGKMTALRVVEGVGARALSGNSADNKEEGEL
ncbi:hypothetical protein EI94DRAFT_1742819 [Lactarius quietus]|nr:hypothetical protein EI94DRAFT_1742819 [Lactarius quietus]